MALRLLFSKRTSAARYGKHSLPCKLPLDCYLSFDLWSLFHSAQRISLICLYLKSHFYSFFSTAMRVVALVAAVVVTFRTVLRLAWQTTELNWIELLRDRLCKLEAAVRWNIWADNNCSSKKLSSSSANWFCLFSCFVSAQQVATTTAMWIKSMFCFKSSSQFPQFITTIACVSLLKVKNSVIQSRKSERRTCAQIAELWSS